MEDANRAIDGYEISFLSNTSTSITEAEKNIGDIELTKDNTVSKDKLYEQNGYYKNKKNLKVENR